MGGKHKIYIAGRNLSAQTGAPAFLKLGHTWVIIKKPVEQPVNYSAAPELFAESGGDVLPKIRDESIKDTEQLKNFLNDVAFGALAKIENWKYDDSFNAAKGPNDFIVPMMPREGDTDEDVKEAIQRIENAFNNYNNGVPYTPIPSSTNRSRNSNSFSYTLLRAALSEKELYERLGKVNLNLPGFGLLVEGMNIS